MWCHGTGNEGETGGTRLPENELVRSSLSKNFY